MKLAAIAAVSALVVLALSLAGGWMRARDVEDLKVRVQLLERDLKTCKATRDVEAGVIQACFNAKGTK